MPSQGTPAQGVPSIGRKPIHHWRRSYSGRLCQLALSAAEVRLVMEAPWLTELKVSSGPWDDEDLVVLSLFDGLGAIWQALSSMGIPFKGYSSEVVSKQGGNTASLCLFFGALNN